MFVFLFLSSGNTNFFSLWCLLSLPFQPQIGHSPYTILITSSVLNVLQLHWLLCLCCKNNIIQRSAITPFINVDIINPAIEYAQMNVRHTTICKSDVFLCGFSLLNILGKRDKHNIKFVIKIIVSGLNIFLIP